VSYFFARVIQKEKRLIALRRIYLVSCIGLGWALQSRTHIAVSVILNFFSRSTTARPRVVQELTRIPAVGGGLQITMGITSVLLVDLFPGTGGAITASVSCSKPSRANGRPV
jgi:hypothetical protein